MCVVQVNKYLLLKCAEMGRNNKNDVLFFTTMKIVIINTAHMIYGKMIKSVFSMA